MTRIVVSGCLFLLLPLGAIPAFAQEPTLKGAWPQFRGPLRNAVSTETGLMSRWPDGGPKLVWQAAGAGRGYASLAIVDNRMYTLGDESSAADDKDEYVTCFDLANGEVLWQTKTGPPWTSGKPDWQSSRSTPTVDGERLYVLTPFGQLVCLESANGKRVWQKHLADDFGGKKGDSWGYSESVLIDGDRLICTPGGDKSTMVALDKKTGELIWKAVWPADRGAGHSSIVISQVGGTRVYVQTTAGGALGVRAQDGQLLWTYGIDKTIAVIPTPIVRDDLVFFCAGYGRGGALLRQVASDGTITVEEIYPLNKDLANKHGGVVLVGDYLFGDSDDKGMPWCAELMTGQVVWKSRGSGRNSAAILAADERLYIRFADGLMVLAKASPDGYEEVGSFKIPDSGSRPSWSYPIIVGGRLYLREQDRILGYDVRSGN
ncbi:MAG: PQQ-like beta-propeller repeat protein [Planctomycetes bacterium]|nr:PQQ-like beta-propeller repeat protein [Planctomycetota bacterium]